MDASNTELIRQEKEIERAGWEDPVRGKVSWRTLFSGDTTPTGALTTGVAELSRDGLLALHRHEPAETYYVLEGRGVVTLDGTEYDVTAGSSVFIPGETEHAIRNTGTSPLRVFYAFAADSLAEFEYRFSGTAGDQDPT